jgi:hypothetical protein
MKARLYFEPLDVDLKDEPIAEAGLYLVSTDDLLTYIEENWDRLVDPTEPVVGALRPLLGLRPSLDREDDP